MKRVIIFVMLLAVCGGMAGVKLYSNGLLIISPDGGVYSTFSGGVQTIYDETPFLAPNADSERWDFIGDIYKELNALGAEVIKTEEVCGVTVVYAFTARLTKSVTLSCGKINIMAAQGNGSCIGYPMLEGSY